MIDRAFRLLVRNYWSVFFVVAAVTVPLHVVYATIYHDVIAVADLHADIEQFPPLRQVHGVGRSQLDHARLAYWIVWAIEIALIPLFLRATRRVVEADISGRVAGAADGWRGALSRRRDGAALGAPAGPGPLIVGAAVTAVVFMLVSGIGSLVVEPIGDDRAFAGLGLAEGIARAAAAPFALVVAVSGRPKPGRTRTTE